MPMKYFTLNDQWTDVGPCPIHVRAGQWQNVFVHYGITTPPTDEPAVLPLYGPGERAHSGSGERCFLRAMDGAAEVVVTTVTLEG